MRQRRTAITAKQLADRLGVSERTIYRDIQALSLSGTPIEGEAGVGYCLQRHFDLPPIMFDSDEVEALLLGVRMVRSWSDRQLATSANSALSKIMAVLPEQLQHIEESSPIKVPDFQMQHLIAPYSEAIRAAIRKQHKIHIHYTDAKDGVSERTLWPFGLYFWGKAWTLVAWCELRRDYRVFRLDRIDRFATTDAPYQIEDERSLHHYLAEQKRCYDEYMSDYPEMRI